MAIGKRHLKKAVHMKKYITSNTPLVGFARNLHAPADSLPSNVTADMYTDYVATRWYRAPELLLG